MALGAGHTAEFRLYSEGLREANIEEFGIKKWLPGLRREGARGGMIGIPLSAARWNQNLIFQLPMTGNHISNQVLLYYKNDLQFYFWMQVQLYDV